MTQNLGERNAPKGGSISIHFDKAKSNSQRLSNNKFKSSEISDIQKNKQMFNKSSTAYVLENTNPRGFPEPDYRGDDSTSLVQNSFSLALEGNDLSNSNRSTMGLIIFAKENLEPAKTVDIPYTDVSKLSVIDFDESVYRQDDSKSDEEFLDKRFMVDLEERMRERNKRMEQRRRTKGTRTGLSTYDRNSGENCFQNRECNLAAEAKENIVHEVLGRRDELPFLQAYLEKLSPAIHSRWQRRWVVVVDFTIFYFRDEVKIESREDAKNHYYLNMLPLTTVARITKDDKAKRGEKFEITARDPRTGDFRHYKWRCKDAKMCNYWVSGLVQHRDQALSELKIGARSRFSIHEMVRRGTSPHSKNKSSRRSDFNRNVSLAQS